MTSYALGDRSSPLRQQGYVAITKGRRVLTPAHISSGMGGGCAVWVKTWLPVGRPRNTGRCGWLRLGFKSMEPLETAVPVIAW